MTQRKPRCSVCLVDLTRDYAANVGQSQQDAETSGALAVGSTVAGEPGTITPDIISTLLPGLFTRRCSGTYMLPPVQRKQAVAIRYVAKYRTPGETSHSKIA